MKHPITTFTRLFGAAALSTLVAACGSGGGDSDSGPVVPSSVFRITCTVVEQVGGSEVAVDNASVVFNAKGNNYSTATNPAGKCTLDVPAADVQGSPTFPAATVSKDGYEPNAIICQNATTGTACDQKVTLVRLSTNTSLPENGDVVMHIGDGRFDGQINSQLQKDTDGQSFDFTIADWGTKLINPAWTRATVVLDSKGWQTTNSPGCANTISILGQGGGSDSLPGGNSLTTGEWTVWRSTFDVAKIGRTGPATLRIASGVCAGGTGDIDDVETNRIRVYYCDATGASCGPTP
jgi:hypothetical protein